MIYQGLMILSRLYITKYKKILEFNPAKILNDNTIKLNYYQIMKHVSSPKKHK